MTEPIFENFEIAIQALPKEYYNELLKNSNSKKPFLSWFIKPGAIVKKSEVIGEYNVIRFNTKSNNGKTEAKASIRAPFSGKITYISWIEYSDWNREVLGEYPHKSTNRKYKDEGVLEDDKIQFKIQPIVGDHPFENDMQNRSAYNSYLDIMEYAFYVSNLTYPIILFRGLLFKGLNINTFKNDRFGDYPEYLAEKLLSDTISRIDKV